MIKNDAISLASEIIEVQKKAVIDKVFNGVLVCTDTLKGKYHFVPLDLYQLQDGKSISELRVEIDATLVEHTHTLTQYRLEIATLQERVSKLERQLELLVDHLENEGDPLATDEPLSDTIAQGETL